MDVGHLVTLVLAAGGALSAAIGVMYRTIMQLNEEQSKIREELGELRGKNKGIQHLSEEVMQVVHNALNKRGQE